jgi:hypothetical protein
MLQRPRSISDSSRGGQTRDDDDQHHLLCSPPCGRGRLYGRVGGAITNSSHAHARIGSVRKRIVQKRLSLIEHSDIFREGIVRFTSRYASMSLFCSVWMGPRRRHPSCSWKPSRPNAAS